MEPVTLMIAMVGGLVFSLFVPTNLCHNSSYDDQIIALSEEYETDYIVIHDEGEDFIVYYNDGEEY